MIEWKNKLLYIHKTYYYSAVKIQEVLIHKTALVILINITINKGD